MPHITHVPGSPAHRADAPPLPAQPLPPHGLTAEGAARQRDSFLRRRPGLDLFMPDFLDKHTAHSGRTPGQQAHRPLEPGVPASTVLDDKTLGYLQRAFADYMRHGHPQATADFQPLSAAPEGHVHLIRWTPPAGTIQATHYEQQGQSARAVGRKCLMNELVLGLHGDGVIYHLHHGEPVSAHHQARDTPLRHVKPG